MRAGKSPTSRAFPASRRPFRQTFPVPPTLAFFGAASAAIYRPGRRRRACVRRRRQRPVTYTTRGPVVDVGSWALLASSWPLCPGGLVVARSRGHACPTPGGRGHAGAPSPNAAPAGLRLCSPRSVSYLPPCCEDRLIRSPRTSSDLGLGPSPSAARVRLLVEHFELTACRVAHATRMRHEHGLSDHPYRQQVSERRPRSCFL